MQSMRTWIASLRSVDSPSVIPADSRTHAPACKKVGAERVRWQAMKLKPPQEKVEGEAGDTYCCAIGDLHEN